MEFFTLMAEFLLDNINLKTYKCFEIKHMNYNDAFDKGFEAKHYRIFS